MLTRQEDVDELDEKPKIKRVSLGLEKSGKGKEKAVEDVEGDLMENVLPSTKMMHLS